MLEHWKEDPRSCLALIIMLDQFPRNMFRGEARMYELDEKALSTARVALDKSFHERVPAFQRRFFYMPFEHSEELEDPRFCVELFKQLGDDPDRLTAFAYAVRHFEIVERFDRFPHRNVILGRLAAKRRRKTRRFWKDPIRHSNSSTRTFVTTNPIAR